MVGTGLQSRKHFLFDPLTKTPYECQVKFFPFQILICLNLLMAALFGNRAFAEANKQRWGHQGVPHTSQ